MSPRIQRNAPCPCGSGKKYKQCHGRGGATLTRPLSLPLWAIVGMVVVAVGATALLFTSTRNKTTAPVPGVGLPAAGAGSTTGLTPAPYQYDQVNNRYWDPNHMHWHDGPPPDSALRATPPATSVTPVAPAGTTPGDTSGR